MCAYPLGTPEERVYAELHDDLDRPEAEGAHDADHGVHDDTPSVVPALGRGYERGIQGCWTYVVKLGRNLENEWICATSNRPRVIV